MHLHLHLQRPFQQQLRSQWPPGLESDRHRPQSWQPWMPQLLFAAWSSCHHLLSSELLLGLQLKLAVRASCLQLQPPQMLRWQQLELAQLAFRPQIQQHLMLLEQQQRQQWLPAVVDLQQLAKLPGSHSQRQLQLQQR